jgi:hypothetical protein
VSEGVGRAILSVETVLRHAVPSEPETGDGNP